MAIWGLSCAEPSKPSTGQGVPVNRQNASMAENKPTITEPMATMGMLRAATALCTHAGEVMPSHSGMRRQKVKQRTALIRLGSYCKTKRRFAQSQPTQISYGQTWTVAWTVAPFAQSRSQHYRAASNNSITSDFAARNAGVSVKSWVRAPCLSGSTCPTTRAGVFAPSAFAAHPST